jgi:hypothetical protein
MGRLRTRYNLVIAVDFNGLLGKVGLVHGWDLECDFWLRCKVETYSKEMVSPVRVSAAAPRHRFEVKMFSCVR